MRGKYTSFILKKQLIWKKSFLIRLLKLITIGICYLYFSFYTSKNLSLFVQK